MEPHTTIGRPEAFLNANLHEPQSDLGYITIGKKLAKLNSQRTQNRNTDLPVEGDFPVLTLLTHRPRGGAFVKFRPF